MSDEMKDAFVPIRDKEGNVRGLMDRTTPPPRRPAWRTGLALAPGSTTGNSAGRVLCTTATASASATSCPGLQ
jgi:hypothetical protein